MQNAKLNSKFRMQNAKLFFFIYYIVIPSECNERGNLPYCY